MKKILIDKSPIGIKTALVDNGNLIEILIDEYENKSLVGNIYIGMVERIIDNQFAFIDIGEDKNGFLQLEKRGRPDFKQGEQILVKVNKDVTEDKGAFLSREISVTGRYLILIKDGENNIHFSRKILNDSIKDNIKNNINLPKDHSIIVRTEAKDVDISVINRELEYLYNKLKSILDKGEFIKAPFKLYSESILEKSLKIFLASENIDEIVINSKDDIDEIKEIGELYDNPKIIYYDKPLDIYDHYNISSQIEEITKEKIWLKSGGFLYIEETRACTVIDVNTGKFVKKSSQRKIIKDTNLEASTEIAKQMRLRNLSGIIIIDYIDLYNEDDREELIKHFQRELNKDRIGSYIVDFSSLSIMQITRKRTRQPIKEILMDNCPVCKKDERILKLEFLCENIYKLSKKILYMTTFNKLNIKSNKPVIDFLKEMESFKKLEEDFNGSIDFTVIKTKRQDYYEIEKEKKGDI